jgi:hypothetical protein
MEAMCFSETSVDTDTCFHAGILLNLFFRPWRWRRYAPLKRRLTLAPAFTQVSCSIYFLNPEDGSDMLLRNVGCRWHLLSRLFLAQLIFSTLNMKATCFSETSVDTQRTTRRYIPEDGTLHIHRCENLKSYVAIFDRVYLKQTYILRKHLKGIFTCIWSSWGVYMCVCVYIYIHNFFIMEE